MSTEADIVERLRENADMMRDGHQDNLTELWHSEVVLNAAKDAEDAADLITKLRADLAAEKEESASYHRFWIEQRDEAQQFSAERDAAREAVQILLPPGNEAMEDIIWEGQPDDALMTIRIRYGQFKRARTLLATEGKSP